MILGETRKQVIVVTGTKQEAKVLARADVEVLIAGNDQAALAQQLAEVAPRAAGFVSFGMAGAIDRTLRLGQWLIARRVSGPHAAMADEAWVEALKTCLPGARLGSIYADGRLFATQQDKVEQSATSAAMAVDMESHLVAQIAQKTGVPLWCCAAFPIWPGWSCRPRWG
jgi:nucleoside phosphorylase